MLSSITPLGERGRYNRWVVTVVAYIAASSFGWRAARRRPRGDRIVAPTVTRCRARGARGRRARRTRRRALRHGSRLPTNHRQVNERWLDEYRGWVYGIGYGFQLGLGVVTIVTSAATYLTFVAAFLCHSVLGGLAIGPTFGLVRALPVLLTAPVRTPAALRGLLRRNARWAKGGTPARSRWAGVRARGGNPCDDGALMKLTGSRHRGRSAPRLGGPDQRPASASSRPPRALPRRSATDTAETRPHPVVHLANFALARAARRLRQRRGRPDGRRRRAGRAVRVRPRVRGHRAVPAQGHARAG